MVTTTDTQTSYDGDAATTAFAFPFKVLSSAELLVHIINRRRG